MSTLAALPSFPLRAWPGRLHSAAARTPAPDAIARRRARLIALARLMDNSFRIPGLGLRFGLDPILGLIPAAGDAIGALISLYIVIEGYRLGATPRQLTLMLANIAIDLAAGAVPILGDLADLAFKANTRNLAILGIHAAPR